LDAKVMLEKKEQARCQDSLLAQDQVENAQLAVKAMNAMRFELERAGEKMTPAYRKLHRGVN
jgi:hypothetical protein